MANKKERTKTVIKKKTADNCFTIMPFGGFYDSYYAEIYAPAIIDCGLTPTRADDLFRSSSIVNDIWTYTKKAKIILADLTEKNPNVFYELGLAHAISKPAILLAQSMEDVPFDLRGLRIIIYDKNHHNWGQLLKSKIKNAIKETLQSPSESIPTPFMDTKGIQKIDVTPGSLDISSLKKDLESIKNSLTAASASIVEVRPRASTIRDLLRTTYPSIFDTRDPQPESYLTCPKHRLAYPTGGQCPKCQAELGGSEEVKVVNE